MDKPDIVYEQLGAAEGLSDPGVISIKQLKEILHCLASKYETGEATLLRFDAGYNNICVDVVKPKPKVSIPKPPSASAEVVALLKKEYEAYHKTVHPIGMPCDEACSIKSFMKWAKEK